MMKYVMFLGAALLFGAVLTSCSDNEVVESSDALMVQPEVLALDGGSDYVTISKGEHADWQIVECPAWITPVAQRGKADDDIRLYFESNGQTPLRQGDIIVRYSNGRTHTTRAEQNDQKPVYDMRRSYAVGWGFDIRTYNDSRGLRDQIFNLQRILETDSTAYSNVISRGSDVNFYYGDDASSMQNDMKAKLNISGKFKVFSLDLKANFGMNEMNNSKRIFSTIRARFAERHLNINADLDNLQKYDWFTTDFSATRQKVIDSRFNADSLDAAIKQLLNRYGTHFVMQAELGGCYDYYYSSVFDTSSSNINVQAALNFSYQQKFNFKGSADYSNDLKAMSNEVIEKFSVKGGDNIWLTNLVYRGVVKEEDTDKWLTTVRNGKLELLWFDTLPIWDLFPDGNIFENKTYVGYDADMDVASKIESYCERLYYSEVPVTRSNGK